MTAAAPPTRSTVGPSLEDPRLTAAGLLFEAADGLRDTLTTALSPIGLARPELDVLIRLARSPDHRLRMSDLAAQIAMSASGLTRLVDRLERNELVRREICPSDRRGSFAVATELGLDRIAEGLGDHLREIDRSYTGLFEPSELEALMDALRRVRDVVRPAAVAGATTDTHPSATEH